MKTSTKQIAAYIQAGISILLILCTFLPFITMEYNDCSYSLSYLSSYLTFSEYGAKYQACGYIFIIYFMLHVLNVFIQAHGSQRAFSCLLSIIGFTLLIVIHVVVSKMHISDFLSEEFSQYGIYDEKIETAYDMSFYLIIVLLVALILLPSLVIAAGNNASSRENDDQDSSSSFVNSKADTEKEIEALKAQIEDLENNNK